MFVLTLLYVLAGIPRQTHELRAHNYLPNRVQAEAGRPRGRLQKSEFGAVVVELIVSLCAMPDRRIHRAGKPVAMVVPENSENLEGTGRHPERQLRLQLCRRQLA